MAQAGVPGLHPDPPRDLAEHKLPICSFHIAWYRVYRCARDPRFFGRTGRFRFDAPAGEYGVLYIARSREGAFIEAFGSVIWVQSGRNYLDEYMVHERCWGHVASSRPLQLVDLAGKGLAKIGADERLCAGDYAVSQRWSKAFCEHPQRPDGIYYRARHDPSQNSAALFDRADDAVSIDLAGSVGANARLLARVLRRYSIGLV